METKDPVPQRVITVSIFGVEKNARVFYSYSSPISGNTYVNAPTCEIKIDQPTHTMYVLDFAASMNGWTFSKIVPRNDPKPLVPVLATNKLSISTLNPYEADYPDHAYYIEYYNTITHATMPHDPQENNVPPPG